MAIKLTGMSSGLDTDAIITELVKAKSAKKDTFTKQQTKLEWKQTAWKDLNTKIKGFQSKLSNFRFSSSYIKKKTNVSNSSVASVIAGDNAVKGSQTLVVKQLAKAGYLTGGKLAQADNSKVKGNTKISALKGNTLGGSEGVGLSVKVGNKTTNIDLSASSTIDDVVNKLKSAGLNANFDETNQRIFVNTADSGADGDFAISATNVGGLKALSSLGLLTKEELDKTSATNSTMAALYKGGSLDQGAAASYITKQATDYAAALQKDVPKLEKFQEFLDKINEFHTTWNENGKTDYEEAVATYGTKEAIESRLETEEDEEEKAKLTKALDVMKSYDDYQNALTTQQKTIDDAAKSAKILNDYYADAYAPALNALAGDSYAEKLDSVKLQIAEGTANGTDTADLEETQKLLEKMADNEAMYTNAGVTAGATTYSAATEGIQNRAITAVSNQAQAAYEAVNNASSYLTGASSTAVRIKGQDAVIELNGAEFTSSSNTFAINGLTITAKALSEVIGKDDDENPIYAATELTTEDDVDGIYDMIKDLFKQYNELIKEIDTLYGADAAKDYEPLTDEEKEAMTDTEVEKWEAKIKDSLLRHDSTLGSIRSALTTGFAGAFKVNGKDYFLSSFGINTQGFFNADAKERNMFHIDGDSDDTVSAGNTDKLKSMIASDPNLVANFFSELSRKLYTTMNGLSSAQDGVRSYGSFYEDKTLSSQYNDYKSKISKQEDIIKDYEDRYYKQFSKMEAAMSKVNSTSSYLSSMFGM